MIYNFEMILLAIRDAIAVFNGFSRRLRARPRVPPLPSELPRFPPPPRDWNSSPRQPLINFEPDEEDARSTEFARARKLSLSRINDARGGAVY